MTRTIRITDESVFARLKALSVRSGIPMAQLVTDWVDKNESHKAVEVKKVNFEDVEKEIIALKKRLDDREEEEEVETCDECGEEVPEDASFCPYCGVEFADEDEDDED